VSVRGGKAAVENDGENYYFVIPLRNVGTGLGVLHAWHLAVLQPRADSGHAEPEEFRPQTLDLYVPAGDTGYWQGAVRGPDDPFSEGRLQPAAPPPSNFDPGLGGGAAQSRMGRRCRVRPSPRRAGAACA
jgi:hypothetical protein